MSFLAFILISSICSGVNLIPQIHRLTSWRTAPALPRHPARDREIGQPEARRVLRERAEGLLEIVGLAARASDVDRTLNLVGALAGTCDQCFQQLEAIRPIITR